MANVTKLNSSEEKEVTDFFSLGGLGRLSSPRVPY